MERHAHRYRVRFAKGRPLRFIGHLDLHRTWERTLRRAGLPVAYSQGMRPRMRINIGQALPLGCSSQGDLMDLWIEARIDPAVLARRMSAALPPGLHIQEIRPIEDSSPKLQKLIQSCEYEVQLPSDIDIDDLRKRVNDFLAAESVMRKRRGKKYDLRPLVESLELDRLGGSMLMRLLALDGATGRADEVLRELGVDPAQAQMHRAGLILSGR